MSASADDGDAGLRARLRARLAGSRPSTPEEATLAGLPLEVTARYRHLMPVDATAAAVLIPLIDHADGLTVLLTERASDLRHHPGQISFPGGRLEADDDGPVAAALRETEEEIGLARRYVEVLGYLPDHIILTGYRVTPIVALVHPGVALTVDPTEVASVFEVPLAFVLDPRNHRVRRRPIGKEHVDVYDLPFGGHNIWGATAGMLITLSRLLEPSSGRTAG